MSRNILRVRLQGVTVAHMGDLRRGPSEVGTVHIVLVPQVMGLNAAKAPKWSVCWSPVLSWHMEKRNPLPP
jgi:hypothetical protein